MDMPITALMTKPVCSVLEDDTIDKVEQLMEQHRVSSVLVLGDDGSIFGIITNHDLLNARRAKHNPLAERAWELCTYRPAEVASTATAADAGRLMLDRKVHHMVVTEGGKVIGIVSALDFVAHWVRQADADER